MALDPRMDALSALMFGSLVGLAAIARELQLRHGGEALVSMENNARRFLQQGSVLFGSVQDGDELLGGAEAFLDNVFRLAKTE
jgi:hypothetical protein